MRFCAVLILRFFVAGGDDNHLSESVVYCRVRTVKNYSYPYLTFVTLSVLGGIFLFIWWRNDVYRITYLYSFTTNCLVSVSVVLSVFVSLCLLKKNLVDRSKFTGVTSYLKFFSGMCLLTWMILFTLLVTLIYFLPGEDSFYSAPYEYSRGSSKSCSGAFVDDPDLQKTIFICYPYGDYQDGNVIYVKKRVNALGAVVTYAYATSGRFRFD